MNLAALAARLTLYERLMRLDKPSGTLLLLWPTMWALWLASDGNPEGRIVWIFALGTLVMRSAGCVMNDLADWRYDAHVERTRNRPLATGVVSRREAWILASVLTLASFGLVLSLNRLTVLLSFAALGLAGTYHYRLIRSRDREACFKAFNQNNWVGAIVFAGIFADLAMRRGIPWT